MEKVMEVLAESRAGARAAESLGIPEALSAEGIAARGAQAQERQEAEAGEAVDVPSGALRAGAGAQDAGARWYEGVPLKEMETFIRANLKDAARSVIAVGYYLKNIRDRELFREAGYGNIWDYASARYGFSKSTASRYMARNDRFSVGGNSPVMAEEFRDYSKAQLQEMLSLDAEQLERVSPDMTVREIREMKRPQEREMPYFEIPGQLSIADFPGIAPGESSRTGTGGGEGQAGTERTGKAGAQPEPPEASERPENAESLESSACAWEISVDDMVQAARETEQAEETDAVPEYRPEPVVATSQQEEEERRCFLEADTAEVPDKMQQTPLPKFKNNRERLEWLRGYRGWPVWFTVPQTEETYYRYDFKNGAAVVVKEYPYWLEWVEEFGSGMNPEGTRTDMYLLKPCYHHFADCRVSESAAVEYLKTIERGKK